MRRIWLAISFFLLAACGQAPSAADPQKSTKLTIYSTADYKAIQPIIAAFEARHEQIKIHYIDLEARHLDAQFRQEMQAGQAKADLLLSSAMDLQIRLVNDGYAQPHRTANAAMLPRWAHWRYEAIGFTFEPVVMVFNRRVMAGRDLPRSRLDLLAELREEGDFWEKRIGSYHIANSSVGYLIASQDARQSSEFGALVEAFREEDIQLFDTTAEILNEVENGNLALGYNVLGSYAAARAEKNANLRIMYPEDYTLAVARTAVIPKMAPNAMAAHMFLDFLISVDGQKHLTVQGKLSAVRPEVTGPYSRLGITERSMGPLRPIALGPGLLVYLDQQKRQRLLNLWFGEI